MPLFDSVNQTAEMLAMIYCGIVIGTVYDLLGIFRRLFARHKIAIHIIDLVFCAASLLISCVFIFYTTEGRLKIHLFIGILLGILLQFFGIKPIIKMILDFIFNLGAKTFKKFKGTKLYKRLIK
ncbi:MAG TPA: spore cortex biosynthesis protein YabQ [Firmicutes bacterium]|nr:spore cortex biosynthesis protein YabQ [Bacillota bacterium]